MITQNGLRIASLLAVLLAGSCAGVQPDDQPTTLWRRRRRQPSHHGRAHLSRDEASHTARTLSATDQRAISTAFVDDYIARGNGAISVSVPASADSRAVITALGERLADLGVPRSRILVGAQNLAGSDGRVEVGYIELSRRIPSPAATGRRTPASRSKTRRCPISAAPCSTTSPPRSPIRAISMQPAASAPPDATRRMQVFNNYEQGQTTAAAEDAGSVRRGSDVGSSSPQ